MRATPLRAVVILAIILALVALVAWLFSETENPYLIAGLSPPRPPSSWTEADAEMDAENEYSAVGEADGGGGE